MNAWNNVRVKNEAQTGQEEFRPISNVREASILTRTLALAHLRSYIFTGKGEATKGEAKGRQRGEKGEAKGRGEGAVKVRCGRDAVEMR